jgi:DNA-binding PadR family transcriptional regulator
MIGLWKFIDKEGKGRGLLTIYILYSLKKSQKSGYEILREIDEKCGGTWTPSKGTLYPLLNKLEEEGLIMVYKIGSRSKHVFKITDKGKNTLSEIEKHKKEFRERFFQFKNLFIDIIGKDDADIISIALDINKTSLGVSKKKKNEVTEILMECLSNLKKLEQDYN